MSRGAGFPRIKAVVMMISTSLANFYAETERVNEAINLMTIICEQDEIMLGFEHPAVQRGANNLGLFLAHAGDYSAAEGLLKRVLDVRMHLLGADNLDTLNSINSLAELYSLLGRWHLAADYFQIMLETKENLLGRYHQSTRETYAELMNALSNAGVGLI